MNEHVTFFRGVVVYMIPKGQMRFKQSIKALPVIREVDNGLHQKTFPLQTGDVHGISPVYFSVLLQGIIIQWLS